MEVPAWGRSPRHSIERECERRGRAAVVEGCVALLEQRGADSELIYALGGPPARWVFTGAQPGPDYWLRVWAARGLLWAWEESAQPCLVAALDDDAWKVREMALKVVARHRLAVAPATIEALRHDPSARVAAAADRAARRLRDS